MKSSTIAVALAAVAALTGCQSSTSAATKTVTTTVTVTADGATTDSTDTATDESTPTDETSTTPDVSAADFTLTPKILKQACFGSAGCNVTFRVTPVYSGPSLPSDATVEVTYEVVGSEDNYSNTFTMSGDGQASVDSEESVSTKTSAPISLKITDVTVR